MIVFAHPGWLLLILCVLGVALATGSLVPVALNGLRLLRHLGRTADAALLSDLEAFPPKLERIARAAGEAEPLVARARAAIDSIRCDFEASGIPRAILTVKTVSAALRLLARDLN
ncbi:MAG TPA: hypothetical protein VIG32_07215 [Candidatus Baltobacteraceae bacterium]|jgi:hypothetical protein